jgi:hypothetical protein
MARFQSRLPASLYVAGRFAMGYTEFYNFLIPLYGLSLGMSALPHLKRRIRPSVSVT